jgi:hypothetical protein
MDAHNVLTAQESAAGFRLLFDGTTTNGWRGYRKAEIHPQWRVVEGTLRFHPDPHPQYGHDIISEQWFTNFELHIDWILYERGNSGIMYHVREVAEKPYMTGPEVQLLDDERHPDAKRGLDRCTGACYGLYPRLHDSRLPAGSWNHLRLLVDGDHVEHHLNGMLVCQYELGSEDWYRRVAGSKFNEWPNFARERRGQIVLQDHLDPVAFRNVKIRAW